jgi:hypothetical protein
MSCLRIKFMGGHTHTHGLALVRLGMDVTAKREYIRWRAMAAVMNLNASIMNSNVNRNRGEELNYAAWFARGSTDGAEVMALVQHKAWTHSSCVLMVSSDKTLTLAPPFETNDGSQSRFLAVKSVCVEATLRGRTFAITTACSDEQVYIVGPKGYTAQRGAAQWNSRDSSKWCTSVLVSPSLDAACRFAANVPFCSGDFVVIFDAFDEIPVA